MMSKALLKEKSVEIIKVIAFIVAFLILIEGVSLAFFSEKTATRFKNNKQDAYSFINEAPKTLQIVGVGNSDLYSGFSPLDLWKVYGYTSTVCASARQTISESRDMLELVFESQSPKIVIIETDMLYDHNPDTDNGLEKENKMSDFFDKMEPEHFARDAENVFSVFKFHNYWKGGKYNKVNTPYNLHGYKYNNKVNKIKRTNYMRKTEKSEPLTKYNTKQTDTLVELCRKNNSQVILITLPSVSSWNYERHNAVSRYAKEQGIPYLDLNLCYKEMGISVKTCFRDNGNHLNYQGAKASTEYIGKYIAENYSLDNLSNNTKYEGWNDSLKKFEKFRKVKEKRTNKQR